MDWHRSRKRLETSAKHRSGPAYQDKTNHQVRLDRPIPTQIIDVRSGTTHFDIKLSNVRTAIAFSCSLRLTKATNAMMELFAQTLAEAANAGKMNGNDLLTFARWIKRSERKVYVWDEPLQFEYQR